MAEKSAWVCTDPDCCQYRKLVSDEPGNESFHLFQVQEIPEGFVIANCHVSAEDVADERAELLQMYGYTEEDLSKMDRLEAAGILAECWFETHVFENLSSTKYRTFKGAAEALKSLII